MYSHFMFLICYFFEDRGCFYIIYNDKMERCHVFVRIIPNYLHFEQTIKFRTHPNCRWLTLRIEVAGNVINCTSIPVWFRNYLHLDICVMQNTIWFAAVMSIKSYCVNRSCKSCFYLQLNTHGMIVHAFSENSSISF